MSIEILDDSIKLSARKYPNEDIVIKFSEMPDLLKESRRRDPLTRILSKFARDFVKKDLPVKETFLFVRAVNAWGGLRGANPAKIWEKNKDENFAKFQENLKTAMDLMRSGEPKEAIQVITSHDGVGISFGSKYLRFLCPMQAAVLDQKIRDRTDFREKPEDYEKFIGICEKIRFVVEGRQLPRLGIARWRLADVEAAIFMAIDKNPLTEETKRIIKEKRLEKKRNKNSSLPSI
jgi:hypothetical protein